MKNQEITIRVGSKNRDDILKLDSMLKSFLDNFRTFNKVHIGVYTGRIK